MLRILLCIILSVIPRTMMLQCDENQKIEMQAKFSKCTTKYNKEYSETVSEGIEDMEVVTCRLMDNMVTTCGEVWKSCHDVIEVERMRMMYVDALIMRNRDATFNIEQCHSVKKIREMHLNEEEKDECSEDEFQSSNRKFQECFHSIYTQLNDDVTSLNDSNDVIFRLCQALNNISTVCVSFLDKCLAKGDVEVMRRSHIDQLQQFFGKLLKEKLENPFSVESCAHKNNASENNDNIKSNELKASEKENYNDQEEGGKVQNEIKTKLSTNNSDHFEEPSTRSNDINENILTSVDKGSTISDIMLNDDDYSSEQRSPSLTQDKKTKDKLVSVLDSKSNNAFMIIFNCHIILTMTYLHIYISF